MMCRIFIFFVSILRLFRRCVVCWNSRITVSMRFSRRVTLVWLSVSTFIILSLAIFIVRWWLLDSNFLIYYKAWLCWCSRK